MEAVGELDQDDAHVLRHRDDHLPVVLRLGLLAALERCARELCDALDEMCDVGAEFGAYLVEIGVGVLDDVVQESRCDGLLVEMELRADLRDGQRMVDELLARAPHLATVVELSEVECATDQLPVDARVVALHDRD